ncbi:M50 family metallopeptidase [Streptomyces sp. NPDC050287]|uniref:M50 family metallopeptidase n=1 Tax=Streptomyces TaxID=1883 RepID=UPI00378A2B22
MAAGTRETPAAVSDEYPECYVAALAVVTPHALWRIARDAVTLAHEGGHGRVALPAGRSRRMGCPHGRGHPATTAIRSLISCAVARTFWAISVSASG